MKRSDRAILGLCVWALTLFLLWSYGDEPFTSPKGNAKFAVMVFCSAILGIVCLKAILAEIAYGKRKTQAVPGCSPNGQVANGRTAWGTGQQTSAPVGSRASLGLTEPKLQAAPSRVRTAWQAADAAKRAATEPVKNRHLRD